MALLQAAGSGYHGIPAKNLKKVDFPETGLDMGDFVPNRQAGTALYDLKAVILHNGDGLDGTYSCAVLDEQEVQDRATRQWWKVS